MRARAFLIMTLAGGLALPCGALAGVDFYGGIGDGWRWGSARGVMRGPDGLWRYYGPSQPGPMSFGEPFMDCYVYDTGRRHWVRICD